MPLELEQKEDPTDEELALRVAKGDEAALAILMDRYTSKLLRYGTRFLGNQGEDSLRQAVQDIFIAVYRNIEGFDARQKFSPWIYRIAHNAFIDILRKKERQPLFGFNFDTMLSHPVHEDTHVREKENQEMRVVLERALGQLTPIAREILVLSYFEELSYKEIADVLHVPISTVGVRLARARASLRKVLPDASELPL